MPCLLHQQHCSKHGIFREQGVTCAGLNRTCTIIAPGLLRDVMPRDGPTQVSLPTPDYAGLLLARRSSTLALRTEEELSLGNAPKNQSASSVRMPLKGVAFRGQSPSSTGDRMVSTPWLLTT
jgi:hypothetical protein